jgi:hypothetical protein
MKEISLTSNKIYIQLRENLLEITQWVEQHCTGIVKFGIEDNQMFGVFEKSEEATKFSLIFGSPKIGGTQ